MALSGLDFEAINVAVHAAEMYNHLVSLGVKRETFQEAQRRALIQRGKFPLDDLLRREKVELQIPLRRVHQRLLRHQSHQLGVRDRDAITRRLALHRLQHPEHRRLREIGEVHEDLRLPGDQIAFIANHAEDQVLFVVREFAGYSLGQAEENLLALAEALRQTPEGDNALFVERFMAYQKEYNEVLPTVPVYSNIYVDLYRNNIYNYRPAVHNSAAVAILYATR